MYITLDNKYYISKPSKEEIGKINNRLSEHYYVTDIRKTAELIGNKGCTWCPAIFNGKRKKENFIEIQLIALDFDGGIGFDEIKGISEKYMIPILFAY